MAGIHLPDIGKLGIHIASGINDKKKVSPLNMVENARLKAISNKIDSEKKDRYRFLNKEQKIMKMRDKRIRKRLEDIRKSRTILAAGENNFECKRIVRLPPLNSTKKKGKQSIVVEDESIFKHIMVPSSSPFSSYFPIHEELGSQLKCVHSNSPTMDRKNIKLEILKNSRLKERRGIIDRLDNPSAPRTTCPSPMKVDYQENVINSLDYGVKLVDDANSIAEDPADAESERSYKPLKQSLEDALQAIKACRYLRTPSTQTS